jgi:hypothetical protein
LVLGENSAQHNFSVGLMCGGVGIAVQPGAYCKSWIRCSIGLQPYHKGLADAVERGELPAHHNPTLGVERQGTHGTACACSGAKRRVQIAVGEQARDAHGGLAVVRGKASAYQEFAVRLLQQNFYRSVETDGRVEGGV